MSLITTSEAIQLSRYIYSNDMIFSKMLFESYYAHEAGAAVNDPDWLFYSALATIYNAGRVSGIRRERAIRRNKEYRTAENYTGNSDRDTIIRIVNKINNKESLERIKNYTIHIYSTQQA